MRAHLPLRLVRTVVFAAVCVLLAAAAHWLSGGPRPSLGAMTAGGGAVLAVAAALGGRERQPAAVAWLLVIAQLGLHELFGGDRTGYVAAHLHGEGLAEAFGMLVAHLTATLLTAWWLARGEAALWATLRRLVRR